MNPRKLLRKAIASPNNFRFNDLVRLVESPGFKLSRTSGSHHIYLHPDVDEAINLQNVSGKAKPYQVRQVLSLVERYNLQVRD